MRVQLFGRFTVTPVLAGLSGRKVQELLAFVLLWPDRPHAREHLAHVLWASEDATQPRAYLRKALWQLQRALVTAGGSGEPSVLHADAESIEMCRSRWLHVDVHAFDAAFEEALSGGASLQSTERLGRGLELYRGDLLEGWYLAWCDAERERLNQRFVTMAGWMLDACARSGEIERGLSVAARVLMRERAHEQTHRHVMRLLAQGGDRTSAIRQFERCREILHEELGVEPSRTTVELLQTVRSGRSRSGPTPPLLEASASEATTLPLVRRYLERLLADVDALASRVRAHPGDADATRRSQATHTRGPRRERLLRRALATRRRSD